MSEDLKMCCEIRKVIKDIPVKSGKPSMERVVGAVVKAVEACLYEIEEEGGKVIGGLEDGMVIELIESLKKKPDLRECEDFPFRLAARYGRAEVMRYLYKDKKTRPSKQAMVYALSDALDAGHLEAARFAMKRIAPMLAEHERTIEKQKKEIERLNEEVFTVHQELELESELRGGLK